MKIIERTAAWLFPADTTERKLLFFFLAAVWLKFLLFDILWCSQTTFTSFSTAETWLFSLFAAMVFLIPLACFRAYKTTGVLMVLLDIFLIANLMYFRTYYTVIPLQTYALGSNLEDFMGSVWASIRPVDICFPLLTALPFLYRRFRVGKRNAVKDRRRKAVSCNYLALPGIVLLVCIIITAGKGGFTKAYGSLMGANKMTCGTPMYTVFGSLAYDYLNEDIEYTESAGAVIQEWLEANERNIEPDTLTGYPDNIIVILAESFESWVLGKTVDGQEITPNLNSLLGIPSTFYAPHVLSQVKGGRSIDGQLLVNTGLLPIESGSFSTRYANNYYPSLVKAFKEKHPGARASAITVDKNIVWNQVLVAPSFGFDSLLDRSCFIHEEKVGPRQKTGDGPFFRQIAEKITSGEIWDTKRNNYIQVITYSGHSPFKLPEELHRISFETKMPEILSDYMIMANYTDHAIGNFLSSLKESGIYDNTMIVITGDHEGLADNRAPLRRSEPGTSLVSEERFVPLIVANSPVGMHYGHVKGQVDIYPTVLSLAGLDDYEWHGLGRSISADDENTYACDPQLNIIGDRSEASPEEIKHLRQSWQISDMIIRFDYLGRQNR